jgi:hypothetical protein
MKKLYTILLFVILFLSGMLGGTTLINWLTSILGIESYLAIAFKIVAWVIYSITGGIFSFLGAYFATMFLRHYLTNIKWTSN